MAVKRSSFGLWLRWLHGDQVFSRKLLAGNSAASVEDFLADQAGGGLVGI
jgi:hypothetical protein